MAIIKLAWDTTTNHDILKEGSLRKVYDTTSAAVKVYYKPLVNDLKSDEWYKVDQRMAGLVPPVEVVDGQNVPIQTPVLGGQKTYTQRMWSMGFRMTRAMRLANKYSLFEKLSKQMAGLMKRGKDIEIHVPFNSPTSAALTCGTGYDALALAHDTHTGLLAGSTADNYDNYLNEALSYSSLTSCRTYFATMVDDMGQINPITPTLLVHPPALFTTVQELLKSEYKPFEDSNTVSALQNYLKPYEDPLISSATRWIVIAKDDMYDFNVFTFNEPEMETMDAPDTTGDRYAMSRAEFTYGWGDPRRIYVGK